MSDPGQPFGLDDDGRHHLDASHYDAPPLTHAHIDVVAVQIDHGHADVGYMSVDIDDGVVTHVGSVMLDDVPLTNPDPAPAPDPALSGLDRVQPEADHPETARAVADHAGTAQPPAVHPAVTHPVASPTAVTQPVVTQPVMTQQAAAPPTTVQPAPPDLNQFPALAAIDAQGTQNTLNTLSNEVHALEGHVGAPAGVPTIDSALARVQDPGGGLHTASGMPLLTLGPGTPEGDRLAAALGPLGRLGPLDELITDEHGQLRPSLGSLGPIAAQQHGVDIDPGIARHFFENQGGGA